jgi:hypothetical protein
VVSWSFPQHCCKEEHRNGVGATGESGFPKLLRLCMNTVEKGRVEERRMIRREMAWGHIKTSRWKKRLRS